MPENFEIFQPMTNLTWECGKCGRVCSASFLDCAGCGTARANTSPVFDRKAFDRAHGLEKADEQPR